jgi:hypothetical protein
LLTVTALQVSVLTVDASQVEMLATFPLPSHSNVALEI